MLFMCPGFLWFYGVLGIHFPCLAILSHVTKVNEYSHVGDANRSLMHWFINTGLQRPYSPGGHSLKDVSGFGGRMTSATTIHLGLGTLNHQSQNTTKIKLKVATKFQLWTMKFDLYIIFIKYCSGFQVLNPASLNHLQHGRLLLQHRCFLWSLSCFCSRESRVSSNKINAWQSLEGVFSTLQALWQNGLQFYSNDTFFSLFFDSVFIFFCLLVLLAYKLFTQN